MRVYDGETVNFGGLPATQGKLLRPKMVPGTTTISSRLCSHFGTMEPYRNLRLGNFDYSCMTCYAGDKEAMSFKLIKTKHRSVFRSRSYEIMTVLCPSSLFGLRDIHFCERITPQSRRSCSETPRYRGPRTELLVIRTNPLFLGTVPPANTDKTAVKNILHRPSAPVADRSTRRKSPYQLHPTQGKNEIAPTPRTEMYLAIQHTCFLCEAHSFGDRVHLSGSSCVRSV